MSFLKAWQVKPLPSLWCNLEICLWHNLWRTDKVCTHLLDFDLRASQCSPTQVVYQVFWTVCLHKYLYLPSKDWRRGLQVDQLIDHKHVNHEGHPTRFASPTMISQYGCHCKGNDKGDYNGNSWHMHWRPAQAIWVAKHNHMNSMWNKSSQIKGATTNRHFLEMTAPGERSWAFSAWRFRICNSVPRHNTLC